MGDRESDGSGAAQGRDFKGPFRVMLVAASSALLFAPLMSNGQGCASCDDDQITLKLTARSGPYFAPGDESIPAIFGAEPFTAEPDCTDPGEGGGGGGEGGFDQSMTTWGNLRMDPWGDTRVICVRWGLKEEGADDDPNHYLLIQAPPGVCLMVDGEVAGSAYQYDHPALVETGPFSWEPNPEPLKTSFTIRTVPAVGSSAATSSPGAGAAGGAGLGLGPGGSEGSVLGSSAPYWIRNAAVREGAADGLRGYLPMGSANTNTARYAGVLEWSVTAIDSNTFNPGVLSYACDEVSNEVHNVIDGSARLRQVAATNGQALADIVTTGTEEFQVRFYSLDQVGTWQGDSYAVSGNPDVTWTIKNPDGAGTYERMRIIRNENGTNDVSEIREIADGWELYTQNDNPNSGAFARVERRTIATESGTGNILEDIQVTDLGGATSLVSHVVRTYTNAAWGRALVRLVEDPGGANRVTRWTYLPDPVNPDGAGIVRSAHYPDGRWAIYTNYAIGSSDVRETWEPWLDLAPESATANTCRRTVEVSFGSTVTNRSVYIEGALVEKSEAAATGTIVGEASVKKDYAYFTPTACLTNATEIQTNFLWKAYVRADGTRNVHVEEIGIWDSSNAVFTAHSSGTAKRLSITHGTVSSPDGVAYRSTREVTVTDAEGRLVVYDQAVYSGAGYATIVGETNTYDPLGHRVLSTRNGRITGEADWDGRTLLSESGERGVVTGYGYDDYGRRHQETRAGVTTTHGYDTEGRGVTTTRSGGGLSLASSRGYHPTGELAWETDEGGLTTSYAYSTNNVGGRIETVTLPSGATRITEYYRDGQLKRVSGTGAVAEFHDYDAFQGGRWEKVYLGSSDASSPRWRKTYHDMLGRVTHEEYPALNGNAVVTVASTNFYDSATGQLVARAEPGLARRLYTYDSLGNVLREGLDMDANGQLATSGGDRISETEQSFLLDSDKWYRVSVSRAWLSDASAEPTTVAEYRDLLYTADTTVLSETVWFDAFGGRTTQTTTINRATATETTTTDTPDSNINAVSVSVNGRLATASTPTVATATQYQYDGLGRIAKIIEPTGATTEYGYTGAYLASVTDPATNTITMAYYGDGVAGAGQVSTRTHPGGTATETYGYDVRGNLTSQGGNAAYPVGYGYDAFGEMESLTTYRSVGGGGDTMTWHRDAATGLMTNKVYADGSGTRFGYNALGQVATRTSARNILTAYAYTPAGQVSNIAYSGESTGTTPTVTYLYDRAGRRTTIIDAAGTRSISYTPDGRPDDEGVTGGILGGLALTHGFDSLGRVNATGANYNLGNYTRTYYPNGRFMTVDCTGFGGALCSYQANSDRVGGIGLGRPSWSYVKIYRTTESDGAGRTRFVQNGVQGGATLLRSDYTYDDRGRRTRADREDGTRWDYGYNSRSEVTLGKPKFDEATFMPGSQFEYGFDDIGNRDWTKRGGDASGADLVTEDYAAANGLNQLTSRAHAGFEWITGEADTNTAVTVNGLATTRVGGYFSRRVEAQNSGGPVALGVEIEARRTSPATNIVTLVTSQSGKVLVPPASEGFSYDADGNLTADGLWTYDWDAENRLRFMTSAESLPEADRVRLEFDYDSQWRRIQKTVKHRQSGNWVETLRTKFVWSDWHLMAELDANNGDSPIRSYMWGPDISGTFGGAGGVGGLLLIRDHASGEVYAPLYDGNCNIIGLGAMDGSGQLLARYEYGPFGEPLRATGPAADKCPFRFSTKYTDEETGLVYYGYRYYNPAVGRWLSRDPLGRRGSKNPHVQLGNDCINLVDILGLRAFEPRWTGKGARILNHHLWVSTHLWPESVPPSGYVMSEVSVRWIRLADCEGKPKSYPQPTTLWFLDRFQSTWFPAQFTPPRTYSPSGGFDGLSPFQGPNGKKVGNAIYYALINTEYNKQPTICATGEVEIVWKYIVRGQPYSDNGFGEFNHRFQTDDESTQSGCLANECSHKPWGMSPPLELLEDEQPHTVTIHVKWRDCPDTPEEQKVPEPESSPPMAHGYDRM